MWREACTPKIADLDIQLRNPLGYLLSSGRLPIEGESRRLRLRGEVPTDDEVWLPFSTLKFNLNVPLVALLLYVSTNLQGPAQDLKTMSKMYMSAGRGRYRQQAES